MISKSNSKIVYISNQKNWHNHKKEKLDWWRRIIDLLLSPQDDLKEYEKAISRQRLMDEYEENIQKMNMGSIRVIRNPIQGTPYTKIELP